MPVVQRYMGFFFGGLAAFFLLLALGRRTVRPIRAKAFARIGVIFAAVALVLFLSSR
jgi:hypothetical protein